MARGEVTVIPGVRPGIYLYSVFFLLKTLFYFLQKKEGIPLANRQNRSHWGRLRVRNWILFHFFINIFSVPCSPISSVRAKSRRVWSPMAPIAAWAGPPRSTPRAPWWSMSMATKCEAIEMVLKHWLFYQNFYCFLCQSTCGRSIATP